MNVVPPTTTESGTIHPPPVAPTVHLNRRMRIVKGGSSLYRNKSSASQYMNSISREVVCCTKSKSTSGNLHTLTASQYKILETEKFSIAQLKGVLRQHDQPLGGNKQQLLNRAYNYLRLSHTIVSMQALGRRYIVRTLISLKGPAVFNRSLCTNDTDTVSMEDIADIGFFDFMSIADKQGCVYGFELCSLENLYKMAPPRLSGRIVNNPYTRETIDRSVWNDMIRLIGITQLLGYEVNTEFDGATSTSTEFPTIFRSRIITYCQQMDAMGNYTSLEWFTTMDRPTLIRYIRHVRDIWDWRAKLSMEMKLTIIPSHGTPLLSRYRSDLGDLTREDLQTCLLHILHRLLSSNDNEMRKLGAMYALTALTLVSASAADTMPALYYSVV